jgi:hypothetical protein
LPQKAYFDELILIGVDELIPIGVDELIPMDVSDLFSRPLLNQGKTVFFTPKLQFLKKVCKGVKTAIFPP